MFSHHVYINLSASVFNRWLLLKDTFVAYVRPLDGKVRDVLLMDSDFEALCGTSNTGLPHGLRISNLTRDVSCLSAPVALTLLAQLEGGG